ncbi:MAG TPA: ABC-F family ATP-binding cassette domain-containing protein [Thermomicrobiaceae bacterium]|nr:ABC-F family ATP-binding cassette domain-containing protein [Thermomicrobiaceae bacterium]
MLQVKHLSKRYGAQIVLDDVSFVVNDGEHVALVGPNGSGKSTLFRCIVGAERPDAGEIVVTATGIAVGYLPQSSLEELGPTVRDALDAAQADLVAAERALVAAGERLADTGAGGEALAEYDAALAAFEACGGYEREHRATAVLEGLGLGGIEPERAGASLSGGQKTRLGMACLLLREPTLLLLDEPTNHLDVEALGWLEGFLRDFPGAVVVVSHDREFLDRVAERVLFLDPASHRVLSYPGDYTNFAEARAREAAAVREAWATQEKYVGRVASDIARLKGEALAIERGTTPRQPGVRRLARKKAGLAKSRERKLERFLADDARVDKPRPQWELKLDFGPPPPGGDAVLELTNVGFGYPGDPPLFSGLNLQLQHGERLALVGPNGAGKTTLLRIIEGALAPTCGIRRLGAGIRVGVLAQEQETLDLSRTVLATALRERAMSETEARSFLHFFLFSGDDVFRPVGRCSFGERTRLQLAVLVLRGCNLLLLDEPLNHLDIEGREHFAAALEAFDGTVVAVVHDRAFLRAFADRVVELGDGQARVHDGGYDQYATAVSARDGASGGRGRFDGRARSG